MKRKIAKKTKFKLVDYIIIALMAAMGIGIKTIIVPLTQIITSALFIPGGVLAGGFYMAFLVLGSGITGKRFTATLIALVQAVVVTITGTLGSHGAVSLLTYTLPGIAVDLLFFLTRSQGRTTIACFFGGVVANLVGSFAVNLTIFNLSLVPLLLSLATASLSGGIGGLIASSVAKSIFKLGVINDYSGEVDEIASEKDEKENEKDKEDKLS